ncbi:DUF349 domain-containing protein [Fulvivirga sp. M361]|uniref:DUF349 domain-containing protein n=1 Tax=Fulvivirga sp. M361 TaxID=2594266 RepID=UPI00117AFFE9|nr:DUF349 domain-containing protein [Fulvivirga sp. M361]TRX60700.1 DUF349 domain-containing protein [Fulvivirga sp. M361]
MREDEHKDAGASSDDTKGDKLENTQEENQEVSKADEAKEALKEQDQTVVSDQDDTRSEEILAEPLETQPSDPTVITETSSIEQEPSGPEEVTDSPLSSEAEPTTESTTTAVSEPEETLDEEDNAVDVEPEVHSGETTLQEQEEETQPSNSDTAAETSSAEGHPSDEAQKEEVSEDPVSTEINEHVAEPVTATTTEELPETEQSADNDPQDIPEPVTNEAEDSTKDIAVSETTLDSPLADDQKTDPPVVESDVAAGDTPKAQEDAAGATTAEGKKELNSETDLTEKEHHHEEEPEEIDYSTYTKEQLVDLIKTLAKDDNIVRSDKIAKKLKPFFDEFKRKDRVEALERFKAEGGVEEDFEYKYDELSTRFDANFRLIRDRRSKYSHEQEQQKDANLIKKQAILERLREFVDADETNINFEDFKEIQNEWKNVGPIPGAHVKMLWANYNALVDRFYDNRSIYFELKELDRRKNLESKLELCERAEKLADVENLKEAIAELNELHHEFKHIGPVPKEEQEPLWQRFKAASDAVYDHRKEFVEKLKGELEENLKVKEQLADEIQAFVSYDSDRIKEWNSKTKELLALQKKWETTGGLPRAKAKEINRKFWGAFKAFFNNKGEFFKKLDAQREGNLAKKRDLVKQADALKDDHDWNKTADEFKKLQRLWKEIGPVPEKYRESVYQEFKTACDHFFNNRRSNQGEVEKEFEANYNKKIDICNEITAMAIAKSMDIEKFRDLQEAFNDIGFVPRKNIGDIKNRYSEAVDRFISSQEELSGEEKQNLRIENQINKIISGPNADQKIHRKEQSLRKQIGQIENDISVWKNNMEFFTQSKNADKLKDEFQAKIDKASSQLQELKQQLRLLRTVS